jgi:hypothetical protein
LIHLVLLDSLKLQDLIRLSNSNLSTLLQEIKSGLLLLIRVDSDLELKIIFMVYESTFFLLWNSSISVFNKSLFRDNLKELSFLKLCLCCKLILSFIELLFPCLF